MIFAESYREVNVAAKTLSNGIVVQHPVSTRDFILKS